MLRRGGPARTRARALTAAAFVDGVGSGVVNAVASVLVAQRFGLVAVGVSVGLSVTGRLGALGISRLLEHRAQTSAHLTRAYEGLVGAMVAAALASLAAAAAGPYWSAVAAAMAVTTLNTVTSNLLLHHAPDRVMSYGPVTIAGQAAGATAGALALVVGGPVGATVMIVLVVGQWVQVPLVGRSDVTPLHHEPVPWSELVVPAGRGFILACCTYGPVGLYAALTRDVSALVWVGPAMVVYSLGALSAPWLDARLPTARRWPTLCLLGAVSVGTWAGAVSVPTLLLGRFVAGATIFVAQGRLFRQAQQERPGLAVLSVTSAGLGIGAGVGAIGVGVVADAYGVPVMGLAFAGLTLAVTGALTLVGRIGAAAEPKHR